MQLLVHCATGAQGGPVLRAAMAAGKTVAVVSRNTQNALGDAATVVGDFSTADTLTNAYRGARAIFVHLPLGPEHLRVLWARNIAAAIRSAKPGRVIFSTSGAVVSRQDGPFAVDRAVKVLVDGLASVGVSYAVIEPRLFLENLLLPHVVGKARDQGILTYPIRPDFPVSWASHLDIADVAVALLDRPEITGVVAVGQCPGIVGADLAEAFAKTLGRPVAYEPLSPEAFRDLIAPAIGAAAAASVWGYYQALWAMPELVIPAERSAHSLLGIKSRTTSQWLSDLGFQAQTVEEHQ